MSDIKQRRLTLPVHCHPGTFVGDYVPFYFCPRSIMLYVIRCANHEQLAYRGGQEPIVHMEANLNEAVEWANGAGTRWAFSLSNAGGRYAEFRAELARLDEINWTAVTANQWSAQELRDGKQAEFLVQERFPWNLVRRIGVRSPAVAQQVAEALRTASHRPGVEIRPDWYY